MSELNEKHKKMLLILNQTSPPTECWYTRWDALRIAFGIIRIAITNPFVKVELSKGWTKEETS